MRAAFRRLYVGRLAPIPTSGPPSGLAGRGSHAALDRIQLDDGVTVTSQNLLDANGDGAFDLVLHLSSGTVTLLGVNEPLVADAFVA